MLTDDDGVRISAYQTGNEILAFCTSTSVDFEKEVKIASLYPKVENALTGEVLSENGVFEAKMSGIGCLIIKCRK